MEDNKQNPTVSWPDGYRHWSGDFNDLVRTAGEIITSLNPGAKAPSASLIRHYQQIKCVGRGQRNGRSSTFGFDELFQAVACKDMAGSGMGLELTSYIVHNSAPAVCQAYSDPQAHKNSAQSLVDRLMQQSAGESAGWANASPIGAQAGHGMPVVRAAFSGAVARSCSNFAASNTIGEPLSPDKQAPRHIKPCEGVDVYLAIDPGDSDAIKRAARALRVAADNLEPPHKPRRKRS